MKISQAKKTLVVFVAQNGPLIARRFDQLPIAPGVGVVFNFDKEYYQQVQSAIVCFGRTASGARRNLNTMMFEVLSAFHTPIEVTEILQRRYVSYTVPDKESGPKTLILVKDQLDDTAENLVLVQCKRLPTQSTVISGDQSV